MTNNAPTTLTTSPVAATQNNLVSIDLATRVSDVETAASNLLFSVSNPTNGAVALAADGHTASFVPTTNYFGAAGFSFTTTDFGTDPRLVFYYNFEPTNPLASNLIADISGNARNASIITVGAGAGTYNSSVPTNLAPFSTQSLRLTQSNNGANAVALTRTVTTGNLSLTNSSWTFVTWFQRATQTNDNFIFYIGDSDGFGGNGDELQLFCPVHTNIIALAHWSAGNVQDIALVSTNTVATNQWHHVAVVFQRIADGTNNVLLYLDGALAGAASNVVWALQQNSPLVFGGHASTTSKTYRWFNGSLDDLALFRGALSPNEIARLANRNVSHFGGFTVTNAISINVVAPPNTLPTLTAIANVTINPGITLAITNVVSDTNQPPPTLVFNWVQLPTNASLATNAGVMIWRPTMAQAGSTNFFSVKVSDNCTPSLSATQNFTVTVNPPMPPILTAPLVAANQISFQINGAVGPDYTIQTSTNLAAWINLFTTNSPALPFNWADTNFPAVPQKFYRVLLGP